MRSLVLFALVACIPAPPPQPAVAPAPRILVGTEPARATPPPVAAAEPPTPAPVSPEQAAQDTCVSTSKVSACLETFGADSHDQVSMTRGVACSSGCLADRRQERLAGVVAAARTACVTASAKNKRARCTFPKAKGPTDAREQSMRFQDALNDAVAHRDDPAKRAALDATMPMMDADYFKEVEPECTRACHEEAAH